MKIEALMYCQHAWTVAIGSSSWFVAQTLRSAAPRIISGRFRRRRNQYQSDQHAGDYSRDECKPGSAPQTRLHGSGDADCNDTVTLVLWRSRDSGTKGSNGSSPPRPRTGFKLYIAERLRTDLVRWTLAASAQDMDLPGFGPSPTPRPERVRGPLGERKTGASHFTCAGKDRGPRH